MEDTPSALLQIAPQCCAHLSGHAVIQVQCCHGLQHPRLHLATHPQPGQAPQQWPGVDYFWGGLQQHLVGLCLKAQKQIVEECCCAITAMQQGSHDLTQHVILSFAEWLSCVHSLTED